MRLSGVELSAELLRAPVQQPWAQQPAVKPWEQLLVELWEAQQAVQPAVHQHHSEQPFLGS